MYYRREGRRRRLEQMENTAPHSREDSSVPQRPNRGAKFTFLSFFAAAACLGVIKASNPDIPLRAPVLVFCGAALACLIMFRMGRRNR